MSAAAQPILMAWSGGKDCLLALARLRENPRWRVTALLTTVTTTFQRVAMHGIRREVLHAQAKALRLPLIESFLDSMLLAWIAAGALLALLTAWPFKRRGS